MFVRATRHGAEAYGLADSLGTVQPGKVADLLVVDADPLAQVRNLRQIRYVVKGGRLVDRGALPAMQVLQFDFDGNERRGLTAMCLRPNGTKHVVAACDLMIPPTAMGGRHLAAYRKWMGLTPFPKKPRAKTGRLSQPVAPR